MTPRALMIMGSIGGIFALCLSFIAHATSGTVVIVFASGALFGNGYGVWEERCRLSDDKETP